MILEMEDTNPLPEKEKPLEITEAQVKDFVSHIVWKEMVRTIQARIEICNMNLATSSELNSILKEQGEVLSLRFLLNAPSELMMEIEVARSKAQLEHENNEDTGEE